MQNDVLRSRLGNRCRDLHATARRLVLAVTALTIFFCCGNASAFSHSRNQSPPVDERTVFPGAFELSNQVGPLTLSATTFSVSGVDSKGVERDAMLSGHALGVDKLYFDQVGLTIRFGVWNHFSIGVPLSFGMAPVQESFVAPNTVSPNAVREDGDYAGLLGIGISPGYEANFGDSAIRFDTAVLARVILVPTNLAGTGKNGQTVSEDAIAGQISFEPRITVLPYAKRGLGLGFFGEIDAVRPENWSCGLVIQARFGTKII